MKTNNKLIKSQEGIAHLGLIVLVVAVIGVVGFGAWRVVESNNGGGSAELTQEESDQALNVVEEGSTTVKDKTGDQVEYKDSGDKNAQQ